jgi:hypothetical protein
MEAKHTPGPWKLECFPDGGFDIVGGGRRAIVVCARSGHCTRASEMVQRHDMAARAANLRRCGCEDCTPFRAAIARAEGRQP